ncbi:MAG: hypothetical protein QW061_01530 [Candidatus Rehaiarchaeum fermentans]|nr:hypothetical protein [Candidatus Rehaiarchaeum fermentans]
MEKGTSKKKIEELTTDDLNKFSISELDDLINNLMFIGQNPQARKRKIKGSPSPEVSLKFDIDSLNTASKLIDFVGKIYGKYRFKQLKMYEGIEPSAFSNYLVTLLTRRSILDDRISNILSTIYNLTKLIERLFYEARTLKERIELFDKLKKGGSEAEAAERTLKQIWIDNVDARRGPDSLLQISQRANMPVLSLFYAANGEKDIDRLLPKPGVNDASAKDKLDYNNKIKGIVLPRFQEYLIWKKYAEQELRTRFQITVNQLKMEYASYKMYVAQAAEYINLRNRMQIRTVGSEKDFMQGVGDTFFDKFKLSFSFLGFSESYYRALRIIKRKVFGERGVEKIVAVSPKPVPSFSKLPNEDDATYEARRLAKIGPKFITALKLDVEFNFSSIPNYSSRPYTIPQSFPEIYQGGVSLNFYSFAFLPSEWNLLNKAIALKLQKTVFEQYGLKSSLEAIDKDMQNLIAEFDKKEQKEEKKEQKKQSSMFLDIYNSFKHDFYETFKNDFLSIYGAVEDLSNFLVPSQQSKLDPDKINEKLIKKYGPQEIIDTARFISKDTLRKFYEDVKRAWITF